MGTNFYLKRIPTKEELTSIHDAVNRRNLDEVRRLIEEVDAEIHVGKRSCGWQFSFDISNYGMPISPAKFSLKEVKRYIKKILSNGWELRDEYGRVFTPDEFWEEVKGWLYHDEKHHNHWSYEAAHPEGYLSGLSVTEGISEDGLRYNTRNFS